MVNLRDGLKSAQLVVEDISGNTAAFGSSSIGTSELEDSSVTTAKLTSGVYAAGHFTLGAGGAAAAVGFGRDMGSPISIQLTQFGGITSSEQPHVTQYDVNGSGFTASGDAAITLMYEVKPEL